MAAVGDYFGALSTEYDSFAQRAMPRREEMLSELVRCLPQGPTHVLELGCGTGNLTALLAERYREANINAVDASPEMIEIARARLPSERLSFTVARFEDLEVMPESFDLIASNMSLHHIAEKGPYYKRLHDMLRPGGFLVFGDEATAAVPRIADLNWDEWLEFARLPGNLTEAEIAGIAEHEKEFDHYETLPDQLDMLRAAGFDPVDCVWRYRIYGVYVAQA